LTSYDDSGRRLIDNPEDFVRMQIDLALRRDIDVIPVLVDETKLPATAELPESIAPIAVKRAWRISSRYFGEESQDIVDAIRLAIPGLSYAVKTEAHSVKSPIDNSRSPLVFLCHSSGDKERVRTLCRQLKADGIKCWFDEEDLLPGQDWEYEISRAIRRSKFVLACLSKTSITRSGYVQRELKIALDVADEQPEGVAFIIPVRLEECEIPERLRRWQWVDLFKDGSYERLLLGLGARPSEGQADQSDAVASSADSIQDPDTPLVYSSNDFNVAVTTTIQQTWWECFGERTHMTAPRDFTKRPDGGVDGLIWPLDNPDMKISFCTFPSPEIKLRSAEAAELLKDCDTPCLIVTRIALNQWTHDAIQRAHPPPVRFLQWTGSSEDKDALETHLRELRESIS
jgi:hypothetical protein